jgi:hypothetical protein
LIRHLYFTLLVTLSAFVSKGQFRYGLKGGLVSSTRTLGSQTFYYAPGCLLGFTSDIVLGKHFFLSPQLYYSQEGNTVAGGSIYRINYLNLAVLGGYHITRQLQFLLGLNFGILINGKTKQVDTTFITTGFYQNIDPGWNTGLRYELGRWGLDFNFVRSLMGIEKSKQVWDMSFVGGPTEVTTYYISEKNKSKNQTFELSIYYLFGSGKSH